MLFRSRVIRTLSDFRSGHHPIDDVEGATSTGTGSCQPHARIGMKKLARVEDRESQLVTERMITLFRKLTNLTAGEAGQEEESNGSCRCG
jgi:hypothetical protein